LPEFTLLENVMIPSLIRQDSWQHKALIEKRARGLLDQVGLAHRLTHFPLVLSGGERQRAAIVRALMNEPELLLCDEPTGNLDSKSGNEIIALIRELSRTNKMTVVLVTHNRELAQASQNIYYLKDGVLAG
jgi:lipoprotein-releasing system ATP-binding protein